MAEAGSQRGDYLSIDEGRVGALGIAVSRSVFGARGVESAVTAVRQHLAEVQSAIGPAGQLAEVDIKGDLPVEHGEHVVCRFIGQEIDAGRGLAQSGGLVHKQVERELAAIGGDTV